MTQQDKILIHLRHYPGLSAYQIADDIEADYASVSSLLKRLCDRLILRREPNLGPRKGYGYFLNANNIRTDLRQN